MSSIDLRGPQVGEKAPEFFIQAPDGRFTVSELASHAGKLVLISRDSYRFHPG